MLRLGTLFSFAVIVALGQVPEKTAYVSIETTPGGDLRASLTGPVNPMPVGLPAAFAHAIGCDVPASEKSRYEYRIMVECPAPRPSALKFHAAVSLAELLPPLLQAGIFRLDLVLMTPHFHSLRVDPVVALQGGSNGYYHAQYTIDRLPRQITIDGGFENSQVRALAAAAVGFILAPFLLLLLRPRDALRLHVQMEGIFVVAWILWIWVLVRVDAGALLNFLLGHWAITSLLALLAPPLGAVWIGSRLAASRYARLAPNGLAADYYRRMRFWSGAAATCLASTLLNFLLSLTIASPLSLLFGIVLTVACLLYIKRIGRGGSRPLSEGDLRKRAFELAARAGVNLRGISILTSPTPRPPLALATRWGMVLLSAELLRQLSRREVDAIVCHELSHLRPVKRSGLAGVYVLLVASILGTQWVPNFADFIPVALLAAYFLIKAWRRAGERQADLDAVRWSGDPEAMITGLARVSHANGVPLTWGRPVSWMMTHPPTMDRLSAIARAGRMNESRLAELLEESRRDPADHYIEAQPAAVPAGAVAPGDTAFSPAMRHRLQQRLTWYVFSAPVVLGLSTVWLLDRMGLPWWAVLCGGSLFSMLAMIVGFEWVVGSVRDAVKRRATARLGPGVFAGFSPAAEPRLFDGQYHYDLGFVRFVDESLQFAGDRAHFTLDRRLVQRVWLGDGPRHWTPRKVVYIECRPTSDAGPVIFSLQSFEAWFWPSTGTAAKRLHREVEEWRTGVSRLPTPPLPCELPQVHGNPNTYISWRTAIRSVSIYSGVAFFLTSIANGLDSSRGFRDPFEMLYPAAVCGLLALFMVWPRLHWGGLKTLPNSPSRLPADS